MLLTRLFLCNRACGLCFNKVSFLSNWPHTINAASSCGMPVPTDLHLVELEKADLLVVYSIVLEGLGEMGQASLATWHSAVPSAFA